MANSKSETIESAHGAPGYLTSALIFAGLTAIWAIIVRADPYYRLTDIAGVRLPVTMLAFLVGMPLIGFLIGRWRYHLPHQGGALTFAGKLVARGVHFTYAHTLIVLFTVAMIMEAFLGLNIDQQVKAIDDRMFAAAARFAPWLCAYLAGFNLGRSTRKEEIRVVIDPAALADGSGANETATLSAEAVESPVVEPVIRTRKEKKPKPEKIRKERKPKKSRAEPVLADSPFIPSDSAERGDLHAQDLAPYRAEQPAAPSLTASGLPQPPAPAIRTPEDGAGFLPPQDLDKLRPTLKELR